MLTTIQSVKGYKLDSLEGEIGHAKEFYFDDQHWAIRYLVVETGNWLSGRLVLISPYALIDIVRESRHIIVNLTKSQIENSPTLESHETVSRHFEKRYHSYYDWPEYWSGPFLWGAYPSPIRDPRQRSPSSEGPTDWDPHLRSTQTVNGYHLVSEDGPIGHVVDFILDNITWSIRYLIIDTRNWWQDRKVLISTNWIERISWNESKVFVKLSREAIKRSPEYHEQALLNREYEVALHEHYTLPEYWLPTFKSHATV